MFLHPVLRVVVRSEALRAGRAVVVVPAGRRTSADAHTGGTAPVVDAADPVVVVGWRPLAGAAAGEDGLDEVSTEGHVDPRVAAAVEAGQQKADDEGRIWGGRNRIQFNVS